MRLKSLQMQGFKSFPDKIELTFDTGLTAVVGPNGSGKSNISDAVRWVLGEQSSKSLRGNKMEDVIFSGTKSRKASAFASVTLTIDNSDRGLNIEEDTVAVNRKLFRSGESEYRINGKSVRLKDVSELFMDTGLGKDGYSIIGQGKIAEIVSSKSSERREIFEEACGVSKFRYKKSEAEKKLALAEDNMLRLNDIVSELESRIEPLREQSEKAKKFVELSEHKKSIEVSVWLFKINDLHATLDGLRERINLVQEQYDELENQVEKGELEVQDGYSKMQESSANVDRLQREVTRSQHELSENKSNVAVYQNDIQHANISIESLKKSKEEYIHERETLMGKVSQLESSIAEVETNLNSTLSEIEKLSVDLSEVDTQVSNLDTETSKLFNDIDVARQGIQKENLTLVSMRTIIEETQSQLDNMGADRLKVEKLCEEYKLETVEVTAKLEEYNSKSEELNNKLIGFQNLVSSKESKLSSTKEQLERVTLEIREKQHRIKMLTDLEKSMEGFSKAVKLIVQASERGQISGVFGTVAQLINTPREYITAIETALGGTMQNIVVKDENTAQACIRFLKSANGGRSTFLPLTSIKPQNFSLIGIENEFGYVGMASDLVSCDDRFKNIRLNLLGKIVVMENLECATFTAKKYGYKFRIVTLDGQVINAGGSFTGGSAVHSGGVLSRKNEIENLNENLKKLSIEEKTLRERVGALKSEVENIHVQVGNLNDEILVNKSSSMQHQADLKRLKDTIQQYENSLNSTDSQRDALLAKVESSNAKKLQCEQTLKELETQLTTLEGSHSLKLHERNTLIEKRTSLVEEVSKLKILQAEQSKDAETLKRTLTDTQSNVSSLETKTHDIETEVSNKELLVKERLGYISEMQTLEGELEIKIESLTQEIQSWQEVHRQHEERVTQLRLKLRDQNTEKEQLSRELIRLDEKKKTAQRDYDNIVAQLFDIYEMTFTEAESFATPVEDIQSAQRELAELKAQIKSLGNVNVSAIDEYNEVSERYKFLSDQLKDTKKSKAELEKLIENLTKDMKTMFEENFDKINENFKQIFVELFGGGSADLVLTDKEDTLNSGIEILVSPPGKVIKSLISLSGGEQAFVSIAIYFAILKVKPSPFCILDEIDAPLDEVNVRKYAVYLNRFIDNTQFIVVTHRRGTMETANVLYGVTMQKDGVSKLLKMEQKDIPNENF